MSTLVFVLVPLVVTVQFEEEQYSVEEEDGPVTLALVLNRAVPFPVTVIVYTLDLHDSSVGDAATGELLEFACGVMFCYFFYDNLIAVAYVE